MKRLLIAGTHSGSGKTTATLAILAALKNRGVDLAAFKCGPDYLDPMFHREIVGVRSANLDPFFSDESALQETLSRFDPDMAIIEGVMGYYDGITSSGRASSWEVARKTRTPVVLVVDVRGQHQTVGAILQGMKNFRSDSLIQGVIFNRASHQRYPALAQFAKECDLTACGFLPNDERLSLGSRHLGLLESTEIADLKTKLAALAAVAEDSLDFSALDKIAQSAGELPKAAETAALPGNVRIAVARDRAFSFLYPENIECLEKAGAEIVYFSPLNDSQLPQADALYLPGGYPELHAPTLAGNLSMRESIRTKLNASLPFLAECGGFLYLQTSLQGEAMVGFFPGKAELTDKLQPFGYRFLSSDRESLFGPAEIRLPAHEFHYCQCDWAGGDVRFERPSGKLLGTFGHLSDVAYASFAHLYFPSAPELVKRFLRAARDHQARSR